MSGAGSGEIVECTMLTKPIENEVEVFCKFKEVARWPVTELGTGIMCGSRH
jgi:hypothetical protein